MSRTARLIPKVEVGCRYAGGLLVSGWNCSAHLPGANQKVEEEGGGLSGVEIGGS